MTPTPTDSLRPLCPTCGGSGRLANPEWITESYLCPDCVDGKVSIERLVAVFNAVYGQYYGNTKSKHGEGWQACIDHLRSVRP